MDAIRPLDDFRRNDVAWRFEGGDVQLSFFVTRFEPGDGPSLHVHPYAEVFLVQEGEATFTMGEREEVVRAASVVVVPGGTPHRFVTSGAGPSLVVSIHPSGEVVQAPAGDQ